MSDDALQALLDVDGIVGGVVLDADRRVAVRHAPAWLDGPLLAGVGRRVGAILAAAGSITPEAEDIVLVFESATVVARPLADGMVLVVGERDLDSDLVRLACGLCATVLAGADLPALADAFTAAPSPSRTATAAPAPTRGSAPSSTETTVPTPRRRLGVWA